MRHCPWAHKQKRRHFHAKTTRANFTCILDWGQGTFRKSRPYPARAYTTLVVLVKMYILQKINNHDTRAGVSELVLDSCFEKFYRYTDRHQAM